MRKAVRSQASVVVCTPKRLPEPIARWRLLPGTLGISGHGWPCRSPFRESLVSGRRFQWADRVSSGLAGGGYRCGRRGFGCWLGGGWGRRRPSPVVAGAGDSVGAAGAGMSAVPSASEPVVTGSAGAVSGFWAGINFFGARRPPPAWRVPGLTPYLVPLIWTGVPFCTLAKNHQDAMLAGRRMQPCDAGWLGTTPW